MARHLIQPSKVELYECSINGYNFVDPTGKAVFNVKEFRIYEDICKFYFTGQLVIETVLNTYDQYLFPTAPVVITFHCPRSDGGRSKLYTETFRVYSYDSRAMPARKASALIEHTISLIGQEYYNDKHNVVTQNNKNTTGTEVAKGIHTQYVKAGNGDARNDIPGKGMIANDTSAHQTINKKPSKAIHDVLDRTVFPGYPSSAPVYYRDKPGHKIEPLQYIMENGPDAGGFIHIPIEGSSFTEVALGYNNIIDLKPLAPASETSAAVSAGLMSGILSSASHLDIESGKMKDRSGNKIQNSAFGMLSSKGAAFSSAKGLNSGIKSIRGGMDILHIINNLHQFKEIDKNGPGGYNVAQEAFLTALGYSQKYWVSVPGQSGNLVTCGNRIRIVFPINTSLVFKTLFVPRLIHEVRLTNTINTNRRQNTYEAKTEIYGVEWLGA
jgi:hypothetical protein